MKPCTHSDAESCSAYQSVPLFLWTPTDYCSFHWWVQYNCLWKPCECITLQLFLIRGSFQNFCTLYVFSLKMSLFYKIHLQAFNIIYIVLYHSGSSFWKILYSCLDALVVNASDYSGHLIRHLLIASEAFPTEWFLPNKSKSGGLSPQDFDLFTKLNFWNDTRIYSWKFVRSVLFCSDFKQIGMYR
jgi:hypothetical protein